MRKVTEAEIREMVIEEMDISSIMTISEGSMNTKYIIRYKDGREIHSDNIDELDNRILSKKRYYKLNDLLNE